jgi:uncharacterized protein (TIGR03435 family)
MLLNLLKDRFQLATHVETREQPIFHLVVARADGRLGPNLKATPPTLSDLVGRPVIDKTGLSGLYNFSLKYAPELGRNAGPLGFAQPPGAPAPFVDPDAPSLPAALQEQLGLKLDGARGPVEVVVIDKFEKPTLD